MMHGIDGVSYQVNSHIIGSISTVPQCPTPSDITLTLAWSVERVLSENWTGSNHRLLDQSNFLLIK